MTSKSQLYDLIHGSDPWIRFMDQIHGADPWIRSMDQIHGSEIRSMDPKGSQGSPKRVPRRSKQALGSPFGSPLAKDNFESKTSKLAEAFIKNWSDRPQNSNASSIFLKKLKNSLFFNDFPWPRRRALATTFYQPLIPPEPLSASTVWGIKEIH